MLRTEPVIAVKNVENSAAWYRKLLGCTPSHGGSLFEILTNDKEEQILSLHRWGTHEHPTLFNPDIIPGNGLILYFVVDNLDTIWENAQDLKAIIEERPHLNTNSGRMEFSLRDPDGYYISICSDE
ncbi:VOC family protein [Zeaxanthinibacter enoshimensis]|uniref:Glyoxalase/bleomycin resistance protein/dioxygenase superfamily protein n=1 Tax=Zeaxanthinibacter enoshimensis TaxID=392009 RepID=A0A4V3D456_9FLAO|nr:VOC family protein [Zeaxanthinibacter enoshimensis]TDQ33031.1 glyoxalase/bleomycin resistance protein/dioxygenase superfamily protein [Zeaxanthinibacter enoshimensis]